MKKKDIIYIPHQDYWTEHFPNPGSRKKSISEFLSDPNAQYNKLLRTQYQLKTKKEMNTLYHILWIIISLITIIRLSQNEDQYQKYQDHHPTNKLRYTLSQIWILIIYTISLILLQNLYRYLTIYL